MAVKKSELYSSLWRSCDELRGGMDASQYKDYVLVLLFVKYVSDKASSQKGYELEVPKGGGFADMVALKGKKVIGDEMNKVVARLADKNGLKGVIDVADWNDEDKLGKGQAMVDRLSNLVGIFDNPALDFRGNRAEGDDLLGDAYEYLMRHFATESGKSKGQFYTPAEVSRIMAKVIGLGSATSSKQTIYDPTCGSGSLLLKAHDEAKGATAHDLALYGQEMDNATKALAQMNLILHDCATGEIHQDNTLSAPHFKDKAGLKTFDFVVANPPFSTKAWTNGFDPANDEYGRFAFGVPPQKNGDYAFLLHILASLKSTGQGAVILPHGVLFRGGAEATIRREVVKRGYLKGIIGLPPNLFYGTGIPACILVLDKAGAATRKGIFMIDASRGFIKDGPKNRLRAQDIHKVVDAFTRQLEVPRYARMVPLAEISDAKNDFNLNLPRYIDASEPEDIQDIDGHLRGGIPDRDLDALERYWKVFPGVREALFKSAGRPGYSDLKVPAADLKATIFGHPEFTAWSTQTKKLFAKWRAEAAPRLAGIKKGDKPKVLIADLAEELLATFQKAKLVDAYDVYQHVMDYWAEAMQDDVYLIASDGWREAAKPRPLVEHKDQKSKDKPDFTIGKQKFKAELILPTLLIADQFAAEQAALDKLEAEAAAVTQEIEELAEEHGGEDGLLAEAKNDKDKLSKASVAARLKDIKADREAADERELLVAYLALVDKESALSAKVKAAQEGLTTNVAARYGKLTEDEIKAMVVETKWLATLEVSVQGELDRVSQSLTGRVRELAQRYATPLSRLTAQVSALASRVYAHLKHAGMQELLSGQTRLPGFSGAWEPRLLGDLGATYGGLTGKSKADFGDGRARYIPFMNVMANTVLDPSWLEMVEVASSERQNRARNGDLFFNGSSETPEDLGMCSVLLADVEDTYLNSFCFGFRIHDHSVVCNLYLAYFFRSGEGRRLLYSLAQGATRYNLSKSSFRKLVVPLPCEREQQAIAAVLSDMDAELTALEQRRDKTRLLKQGMMQELLTGRTRLV